MPASAQRQVQADAFGNVARKARAPADRQVDCTHATHLTWRQDSFLYPQLSLPKT
jgi:hypothetical protein